MKKKTKTKKTCSTTRLSHKVFKRDFCSHVFANPDRYIYFFIIYLFFCCVTKNGMSLHKLLSIIYSQS